MHDSDVGKVLEQEKASDRVFILSLFSCFDFPISWLIDILWFKMQSVALKVGPATSKLYHILTVHHKDGLVGAIGFKMRDVGRELFNGRRRGRHKSGHCGRVE